MIYQGPDYLLNLLQNVCFSLNLRNVDTGNRPTCFVQNQALHFFHFAIPYLNENGSSVATLLDSAALEVAGKHHPRIATHFFVFMDMPESPVLIITGGKIAHGAWGVVVMIRPPT